MARRLGLTGFEVCTPGILRSLVARFKERVHILEDICFQVNLKRDLKDAFAISHQCYYEGEAYYVIEIVEGLQVLAVEELLIHELAHVVNWEEGDVEQDHGDEWGKSLALIYRLWVQES